MQWNFNAQALATPEAIIKQQVVEFEVSAEQSVLVGNVVATPKWLAQWHLVRDPLISPDQRYAFNSFSMTCSIIRDSGVGNVSASIAASSDGIEQTDGMGTDNMNNNTAAFTQEVGLMQQPDSPQDLGNPLDYFGVAIKNSDGATTGRIKNIKFMAIIFLPEGATLERTI